MAASAGKTHFLVRGREMRLPTPRLPRTHLCPVPLIEIYLIISKLFLIYCYSLETCLLELSCSLEKKFTRSFIINLIFFIHIKKRKTCKKNYLKIIIFPRVGAGRENPSPLLKKQVLIFIASLPNLHNKNQEKFQKHINSILKLSNQTPNLKFPHTFFLLLTYSFNSLLKNFHESISFI